jgi:hypothetical protein
MSYMNATFKKQSRDKTEDDRAATRASTKQHTGSASPRRPATTASNATSHTYLSGSPQRLN